MIDAAAAGRTATSSNVLGTIIIFTKNLLSRLVDLIRQGLHTLYTLTSYYIQYHYIMEK